MGLSSTDVAIIGAGPYGLSLATHLRKRKIEHRIFGVPMQTWASMSPGMYLKSLGFATNIYTPQSHFTLPEYCRKEGLEDYEPIKIATFAKYGVWVQQQHVPYVEATNVTYLTQRDDRFEINLANGERCQARRVVIAAGLSYFERIPKVYSELPKELATHTAQHGDFSPFSGQDVTVIGGGQSALQAAALLHEHGAKVRMLVRGHVHWGVRVPRDSERSLLDRIRIPVTVLGHGRDNWIIQHIPMLLHHQSDEKRAHYTNTHLGPGGAWWLRDRVEDKFPVHIHTSVQQARLKNGKVSLRVREEGAGEYDLQTDHVIAGTGYEVDVDRIGFVSPELAKNISRIERAPKLSRHFQSSVRGLYFVGPSSVASFGPLFRFVAGAEYTVPTVARHLSRNSGKGLLAVRQQSGTFKGDSEVRLGSNVEIVEADHTVGLEQI